MTRCPIPATYFGMSTVRWGVLGTGAIAHQFVQDMPFVDNGTVAAVGSRRTETAAAFAEQYGIGRVHSSYEALCADAEVDAIYIATPHSHHLENARMAFAGGKAVLCEKPIAPSLDETDAMIAAAKAADLPLMEAMWTYFLPAVRRARAWFDDGRIGQLRHIQADFGFHVPFDPKSRLFAPELAGGAMLDVGIYPIALAWLFATRSPERVQAVGRRAASGVDDDVAMLFDYGDCTATLLASFRSPLKNTARIVGTEGYIELPEFWRARQAELYVNNEPVDTFRDERTSHGLCYETESFGGDVLAGRKESATVSWSTTRVFQEHIDRVLRAMAQVPGGSR